MRIRRAPLLWVAAGVLLIAVLALAAAFSLLPDKKQELPTGNKDYALSFNGTSSYAVVPDLVPTAGETYTLEAIVTPRGFRTSNVISWLGPDWMAIYLDDAGHWGLARRFGGESYLIYHEQPVVLGEAVHLAGVFRGADLQLFINGRPAAPTASTFGLSETSGGLFLGGVAADRLPSDQNDRFFRGEIDAVRISRGVRYDSTFKPPARFASDSRTIAMFNFSEGRSSETRGTGERTWTARLVDTQWEVGR